MRYVFSQAESEVRAIIVAAYLVVFAVGSCGNGLIIYIIGRYRQLRVRSVANYYIWNLAFADLTFVSTLPLFCWATFARRWPFGDAACKAAYAVRELGKFAGVFTLVALSVDRFVETRRLRRPAPPACQSSVDRYVASRFDLARYRTVAVCRAVCVTVWATALVGITTPYWIYARTVESAADSGRGPSCRVVWQSDDDPSDISSSPAAPAVGSSTPAIIPKVWTYVQFVVGFAAPFLVIVTAYTSLAIRLHRLMSIPGAGRASGAAATANGATSAAAASVKRPGRAMTRMAAVVTATFLLTQLPYYVVELLNVAKSEALQAESAALHLHSAATNVTAPAAADAGDNDGSGESDVQAGSFGRSHHMTMSPGSSLELTTFVWLNAIAKMLVFVCSCCNPIIYGLLNVNYRKLYMQTLCRKDFAAVDVIGSSDNCVATAGQGGDGATGPGDDSATGGGGTAGGGGGTGHHHQQADSGGGLNSGRIVTSRGHSAVVTEQIELTRLDVSECVSPSTAAAADA